VASGRVRKNSVASANSAAMRPRASTFSHVDAATLGMMANTDSGMVHSFVPGHSHHNSLIGLPSATRHIYRGATNTNHLSLSGLPKLETHGLATDLSSGLRTAPPFGGFGAEFGMDSLAYGQSSANTINPHALHMHGMQSLGLDNNASPFQQMFSGISASGGMMDEEPSFDWIAQGFDQQMSFALGNENAIDDSSPSAMDTNSPAAMHDAFMDGGVSKMLNPQASNLLAWQTTLAAQAQMMNSPLSMDLSPNVHDLVSASGDTISPKSLLAQGGSNYELNFSTPPDLSNTESTGSAANAAFNGFALPYQRNETASTVSTASLDSSLRHSSGHSSITTMSSDLVTDNIRNVVIAGLTQNTGFGQRKPSKPAVSSPLTPGSASRAKAVNANTFPSTQDLQRYVQAYIKYFHPHLPFLHVSTLNFESAEYTTPVKAVLGQPQPGQSSITGGGSCLILSISAIGALYEQEMAHSKELFDCAKRLISCYLEERRKANLSKTQFAPRHHTETEDTPLWLVQAMLLNVIYGHNCGDKTAADIASNHCAALVSLARGAELARPYPGYMVMSGNHGSSTSQSHVPSISGNAAWNGMISDADDSDWFEWKVVEERKRTLYAIFILSSMLVTAYNHAPALTNSEIRLDLPCDEELWSADSAHTWRAMGGAALADAKSTSFAAALTHLLTAAQRERQRRNSMMQQTGSNNLPNDISASELRPSAFGCLILVNALHNYIWETRQRHLGRQWTPQEVEQMHAHIEPALRAWQEAWASNPSHSLERPNPFGVGPLSADSIPLLDLAYVRLFVNLGRSKEAFWQRDYDAMAQELAKGTELMHNQDALQINNGLMSPASLPGSSARQTSPGQDRHTPPVPDLTGAIDLNGLPPHCSRRERHLRKAAFYAADSLSMADKLGFSYAEQTARELPFQSAMCAFDCAQVLGEWVTTVQERIGHYVGVLGRDDINLLQVPAALLLEEEDRNLLSKVEEVLLSAEHKINSMTGAMPNSDGGYGSRILTVTAHTLDRAAVWPGKIPVIWLNFSTSLTNLSDKIDGPLVGNASTPPPRTSPRLPLTRTRALRFALFYLSVILPHLHLILGHACQAGWDIYTQQQRQAHTENYEALHINSEPMGQKALDMLSLVLDTGTKSSPGLCRKANGIYEFMGR